MNHTIEITARSADIRPKPNSSSVIVTIHHPIADGAVDLRAMFPSEDEMCEACARACVDSPAWDGHAQDWIEDNGYWSESDLRDSGLNRTLLGNEIDDNTVWEYCRDNLDDFLSWACANGVADYHTVGTLLNSIPEDTLMVVMQDLIKREVSKALEEAGVEQ